MQPIKVLLADHHMIVREGLRALLGIGNEFQVVAEAGNGRQAVEHACTYAPCVAILAITLPELNGLEAARQMLSKAPATRVLILTSHDEDAFIDRAMDCGVYGYIVKQSSAGMFLRAIREVARGRRFFSPSVASHLAQRKSAKPGQPGAQEAKRVELSTREAETLQLIAEGNANKQIAGCLRISIKTVEKHRHNLMMKLRIHDTAGLTRHAIAAGLIEAPDRAAFAMAAIPVRRGGPSQSPAPLRFKFPEVDCPARSV